MTSAGRDPPSPLACSRLVRASRARQFAHAITQPSLSSSLAVSWPLDWGSRGREFKSPHPDCEGSCKSRFTRAFCISAMPPLFADVRRFRLACASGARQLRCAGLVRVARRSSSFSLSFRSVVSMFCLSFVLSFFRAGWLACPALRLSWAQSTGAGSAISRAGVPIYRVRRSAPRLMIAVQRVIGWAVWPACLSLDGSSAA